MSPQYCFAIASAFSVDCKLVTQACAGIMILRRLVLGPDRGLSLLSPLLFYFLLSANILQVLVRRL